MPGVHQDAEYEDLLDEYWRLLQRIQTAFRQLKTKPHPLSGALLSENEPLRREIQKFCLRIKPGAHLLPPDTTYWVQQVVFNPLAPVAEKSIHVCLKTEDGCHISCHIVDFLNSGIKKVDDEDYQPLVDSFDPYRKDTSIAKLLSTM